MLGPQLLCAASELPLSDAEVEEFGALDVLTDLTEQGLIRRRPHGWFVTPGTQPHGDVEIRGGIGHQVSIANSRGPQSLTTLAQETGATPVTVAEAVRAGDVVIVSIPEKNIPDLPRGLFAKVPDGVAVIDTGNYYPELRDGRIDAIDRGLLDSHWVAHQIGRPVIKVFNNIYAMSLLEKGKPRGTPGRVALPVAGESGTLRSRLRLSGKRVRAKTGTLDDVSALSGVITREDGTPEIAFSILINASVPDGPTAQERRAIEDRIVMAVLAKLDELAVERAGLSPNDPIQ